MRLPSLKELLRSPWPYVCAFVVGIIAAVVSAPAIAVLAVTGAALASFLIWRFGALRGLWYLVILTLPLKEPLSFEIFGTVSVCVADIVLVLLFARVLTSFGFRALWKGSTSFRIELAVIALSVASLYTATRFFWGVASVYRIAMLLAVFTIARVLVRDREEALRTLLFVALSLVAPIALGLYQATLPFGAALPEWGGSWTAYDASGNPSNRVFSTFSHPLNFSHYLTIGFTMCLGLAAGLKRGRVRVGLIVLAALAALCNLYTYSAGGILGMLVSVILLVFLLRSARLVVVALLVLVVAALVAPPALVAKVDRLFSGEALTAAARLVTYEQSFRIIRDHPLFGVGWGGIRTSLEGAYRVSRADPVAFTAENYFLQRAIALGIVGLGLYVGLIVTFVRNVRLAARELRSSGRLDPVVLALVVGAAAFFVQAQVIPATDVSTNSVLWLFFAVAEALRARSRSPELPTSGLGG